MLRYFHGIRVVTLALVVGVFLNSQYVVAQQASPLAAVPDQFTLSSTTALAVLSNDGGSYMASTLVVVAQPSAGEVTIVDGQIMYTPNPSFEGEDSFVYGISSQACTDVICVPDAQALVSITVTPELIQNAVLQPQQPQADINEGAVLGATDSSDLGASDVLAETGAQSIVSVAVGASLIIIALSIARNTHGWQKR